MTQGRSLSSSVPHPSGFRLRLTSAFNAVQSVYFFRGQNKLAMRYRYSVEQTENGQLIAFPDVPGAEGIAADAQILPMLINTIISRYFQREMVPMPTNPADGDWSYIELPEHFALEVLRNNWGIAQALFEARRLFESQPKKRIKQISP